MSDIKKSGFFLAALFLVVALSGCKEKTDTRLRRLVLEEGEGFLAEPGALTVEAGEDAQFLLELSEGYQWKGCSYPGSRAERQEEGNGLVLTLPDVRYSEAIQVQVEKSSLAITYFANGGRRLDGKNAAEGISVTRLQTHLRPNTSIGTDLFQWEGHTLTGWCETPSGEGEIIGLGSRTDFHKGMKLYAQWSPWTEEGCFTWEKKGDFAVLTGYTGEEPCITVPGTLGGLPVRKIKEGAFAGAQCERVILPPGINEVEAGAFSGCTFEELTLYDDISRISDYAFENCEALKTLRIQAIQEPVYSGSYFGTFADKYDRLLEVREQQKLVLFSGSSTRFGYDSEMILQAFPQYQPVNMGVFAYSPAYPQLLLILECMKEGDILLAAPEFDASSRQFCSQRELDYAAFAMMEENYDAFARLDIRKLKQVFTAFTAYNENRKDMKKRSYDDSPSQYDEDGNPVWEPSYNRYGDYVVFRPNGETQEPIYGLPVKYTVNAFPKEQYLEPFQEMCRRFQEKGAKVYFTYAPRNRYALSKDSTLEERGRLDAYFRENLGIPVISEIEDSLYSGTYLYGTDNHLSTEGVKIRTQRVIEDLKRQFEKEEGE